MAYGQAVRPWLLAWGADRQDLSKPIPGDSFVPKANSTCTRTISINAPAGRIWPWIAQIGQEKGGFDSYTWIENLFGCRIVNATSIHPEWQDVRPGDAVRLHPNMAGLPVRMAEKDHALVLGGDAIPEQHIPPTTWAFVLEPAGPDRNPPSGPLALADIP